MQTHRQLDMDKVARLRAHQVLRAHTASSPDVPMTLRDFTEQWASSMPGVDTPSKELLKVRLNVTHLFHVYFVQRFVSPSFDEMLAWYFRFAVADLGYDVAPAVEARNCMATLQVSHPIVGNVTTI